MWVGAFAIRRKERVIDESIKQPESETFKRRPREVSSAPVQYEFEQQEERNSDRTLE